MGISGLLPFLKDATTNVNIREFEGATVAVDTYCWIYRGAFGCAEELALNQPANGHVKYVLKYVHKLLEWNIKPIMVFDGSCLPSKKGTEQKRKESKELYRKRAAQCLLEGKRNEARECYQRCIECTPKMALEVIKALHEIGVDVVVAPYEADAQLAYLNKIQVAQIVITEDSDLILFGCEKVFYKLDLNGNGQLVQKEKIISITQFDSPDNFERFRWMCILSGCDYLENLPGIGLGKARKFLKSTKSTNLEFVLKQLPKSLKMPGIKITEEYITKFQNADKTFKYQVVFDPLLRKLVSLNPYDNSQNDLNEDDLTYAGFFYDDETALQHSLGNLHVNNREIVYNFNPDKWNYQPPPKYKNNTPAHMRSVWSKSYVIFKKSNIFTAMATKQASEKQLPNTLGLSKTINNTNMSTAIANKRKLESPLSNLDDSDNLTDNKNKEKRLRILDEIDDQISENNSSAKNLVQNMISEYADHSKTKENQEDNTVCSYFSKSFKSSDIASPIVTKTPKQFLTQSSIKSSNESDSLGLTSKLNFSPSPSKTPTKLKTTSPKIGLLEAESPIQINKIDRSSITSPILIEAFASSSKKVQHKCEDSDNKIQKFEQVKIKSNSAIFEKFSSSTGTNKFKFSRTIESTSALTTVPDEEKQEEKENCNLVEESYQIKETSELIDLTKNEKMNSINSTRQCTESFNIKNNNQINSKSANKPIKSNGAKSNQIKATEYSKSIKDFFQRNEYNKNANKFSLN